MQMGTMPELVVLGDWVSARGWLYYFSSECWYGPIAPAYSLSRPEPDSGPHATPSDIFALQHAVHDCQLRAEALRAQDQRPSWSMMRQCSKCSGQVSITCTDSGRKPSLQAKPAVPMA